MTPPSVSRSGMTDGAAERPLDDRTGFEVAEVLVRTIAELAPDVGDAEAVWEEFIEWSGGDQREYVEAVRRTGHSIFYYHLQSLYEFGKVRTGREDLPQIAGHNFAGTVYEENLPRLLQVALENKGLFQEALVEVFRSYLHRYTGTRYLLDAEFHPDRTVFIITGRDREAGVRYCAQYGLDPLRAFTNSFCYIAGAMEGLFERVVAGFDVTKCRLEPLAGSGKIHTPIRSTGRFAFEEITATLVDYIRRVESHTTEAAEQERLESDLIIGSDLMRETWDRIGRASRSDEIVLLRGESGSGKSFIAKKIHELSSRSARPLVQVCLTSDIGSDNMVQSDLFGHEKGAFTGAVGEKKGLFQLADGGTIFLDEIGDAGPELQAKLLRVMEASTFRRLGGTSDITVDVRVIAATNRDLEQMCRDGTFRQDLYYRLNVISIGLPALRERPEDIPALADFLLARVNKGRTAPVRLKPGLAASLKAYDWPGNIRELDHALKHAAAMVEGSTVTVNELPAFVREAIERSGYTEGARRQTDRVHESAPARSHDGREAGAIINIERLRRAVRAVGRNGPEYGVAGYGVPGHVEYAKHQYLVVLIDECEGDLQRIGRLWDHGSEKTLRKTIRTYGLEGALKEARRRRAASE